MYLITVMQVACEQTEYDLAGVIRYVYNVVDVQKL
jgi:hypothetical protein